MIYEIIKLLKYKGILLDHKINSKNFHFRIYTNSKYVKPKSIFLSYKGICKDGHDYIDQARKNGANLFVLENKNFINSLENKSWILVNNARKAWSFLEAFLNQNPQNDLIFCGVTGTNGKTTIIDIISQIFILNGIKFLKIGTLGIEGENIKISSLHTTPDPFLLFKCLSKAKAKGIKYILMEVSSHSIEQDKLSPISFDAIVFSSFSRDHMDFHKNMENYWNAKWKFLKNYSNNNSFILINSNINKKYDISDLPTKNVYKYGQNQLKSDYNIEFVLKKNKYSEFTINFKNQKISGSVPYISKIYLENFLASFVVAMYFEKNLNTDILKNLQYTKGRFELIKGKTSNILIDYAHSPDAMQKLMIDIKEMNFNKIFLIFGCGGNRDKGKRKEMGELADLYADQIIITNDNPRFESPNDIAGDILSGIKNKNKTTILLNRSDAIKFAFKKSNIKDIIVIMGKGHEKYQDIGGKKYNFSDHEIVNNLISVE